MNFSILTENELQLDGKPKLSYDFSQSSISELPYIIDFIFNISATSRKNNNDPFNFFQLNVESLRNYDLFYEINQNLRNHTLIFDYIFFLNLWGMFQSLARSNKYHQNILNLTCQIFNFTKYDLKLSTYGGGMDCLSNPIFEDSEEISCLCIPYFCYDYIVNNLEIPNSFPFRDSRSSFSQFKDTENFPETCLLNFENDVIKLTRKYVFSAFSNPNEYQKFQLIFYNQTQRRDIKLNFLNGNILIKNIIIYIYIGGFLKTCIIMFFLIYRKLIHLNSRIVKIEEDHISLILSGAQKIPKTVRQKTSNYTRRNRSQVPTQKRGFISRKNQFILGENKLEVKYLEIYELHKLLKYNCDIFCLEFEFSKVFKLYEGFLRNYKSHFFSQLKFENILVESKCNEDNLTKKIEVYYTNKIIMKEVSFPSNFVENKFSYNFNFRLNNSPVVSFSQTLKTAKTSAFSSKRRSFKARDFVVIAEVFKIFDSSFDEENKSMNSLFSSLTNIINYYNDNIVLNGLDMIEKMIGK